LQQINPSEILCDTTVFQKLLKENQNDSKKSWNAIKKLVNYKQSESNSLSDTLKFDNQVYKIDSEF